MKTLRRKIGMNKALQDHSKLLQETLFHLKEVLKFGVRNNPTHITVIKAREFLKAHGQDLS